MFANRVLVLANCLSVLVLCVGPVATGAELLDRIVAETSEAELPRAICDQLARTGGALNDTTFRLALEGRTSHIKGPEWGKDPNVSVASQRATSHETLELVHSPMQLYWRSVLPKRQVVIGTFENGRTTQYQSFGGQPASVVLISCAPPACPSLAFSYLRGTLLKRFVRSGEEVVSSFLERLAERTWGGVLDHPTHGRVAVLQTESKAIHGWKVYQFYIGERSGRLVFLGHDMTSTDSTSREVEGYANGVISRWLESVSLKYDEVAGYTMPVSWKSERLLISLDRDLEPYGPPSLDYSMEMRVSKFELLDSFDKTLFNVPVKPDAKIIDGCEPERGSITAKPEEPTNPYAYLWMAVLGTLLLTVLSAAWWKWRSSR